MKNGADTGFDNIDELTVKPGTETAGMRRRREKLNQQFIMVPVTWLTTIGTTKCGATWLVALHLLRLSWKKRSNTINLSNSTLKELGVPPRKKWRALNELERKKLVTVERGNGKSPRITLLQTLDANSSQS